MYMCLHMHVSLCVLSTDPPPADCMRSELSKISSATDKKHTDLHLVLSEVKVLAMKLENR